MAQSRVPRTLYRQLLSWCRQYKDVPFDGVPPLTLSPPQVNARALLRLRRMRAFLDTNNINDSTRHAKWRHPAHYALYNTDVLVDDNNMIVFPSVNNAGELRDVIRSVYWLNNINTLSDVEDLDDNKRQEFESSSDEVKDQISLALDAMKSCNQLASNELDSRRSRRQSTIEIRQKELDDADAMHVKYHVGQVVSQKKKGWRGVIVGWTVEEEKTGTNRLTSLTTKQYSIQEQSPDDQVQNNQKPKVKYTILVDINDATLLESSKIVSLEPEDELVLVEPSLQRIHNNLISRYFSGFEIDHFVPNKTLGYVYPMDQYSANFNCESDTRVQDTAAAEKNAEFEQSCLSIIQGVDKITKELVLSYEHSTKEQTPKNNFIEPLLTELSTQTQTDDNASMPSVYSSVSALYMYHVKVNSLLWSRKRHLEYKLKIKFSLGQVVKHKLYDYRGVVVAWDIKSKVDVRNWDGLKHIKDPQDQPFYHVIPDENDCIRAFGGSRSFRYVCQDNLEVCETSSKLAVESLNPQEWRWEGLKGVYVPSDELKFLYGEQPESDEMIVQQILQNQQDALSNNLLLVKEGSSGYFSMDDLFRVLDADTLENANCIQEILKEIWKESRDRTLREDLDGGITQLVEGSLEKALITFNRITKADNSYGEAWNKKATAHYLAGHMEESLDAARKALMIDPKNFLALAGIGLVEMDSSSSMRKAVDAFEQCLTLNPWSMVSARLFACLRKLDRSRDREDD